ncbi:hypothetical protein ACJJTC_007933 [Scirpophaga incertulas]
MDLQILLAKMKEQFEKQTMKITENVTAKVSATIDEKLTPILEEQQILKKEITLLKTKFRNIEKDLRKRNVILHGVKESEKSFIELLDLVLGILNEASQKGDVYLKPETRSLVMCKDCYFMAKISDTGQTQTVGPL